MLQSTFRRVASVFLLLMFAAGGAAAQNPSRLPSNFSLQVNGQVRYAASRRPAENVLVRIENFTGGMVAQTTTDRNGKFSFTGLESKQYIVTVHAPGFQEVRQNVDLVTANSGYLNIELASDNDAPAGRRPPAAPVIDANLPPAARKEFERARALLDKEKKEKFSESLPYLEKAVAIYPQYLDAQILLGLVYMDLGLWEKAEKPLRAALAIDQRATTAHFALGETYRRMKKYADAEKVLTEGIKINENSPAGHYQLAKVYWDVAAAENAEEAARMNFEKSWQAVKRALALDPNLAEAHILAGNLLLRARRAAAALTHFEQYLKLAPQGEFAGQAAALVKKIKKALPENPKQ
ncbi:MAG TPA: carboxypeptidase regulatory-like domain-containing protein [Pyrinomonadaceae bacterium]|jgi:Tfp pilus assembly protein PilF